MNDLLLPIYQQGIKQPCETKATVEIIIFGKSPDERNALAASLYVQESVMFLVKKGTRYLAYWRGLKTDKRTQKSKAKHSISQ